MGITMNKRKHEVTSSLRQLMKTQLGDAATDTAVVALAMARCEDLAKTIDASCYGHTHLSEAEERLCAMKSYLESEI